MQLDIPAIICKATGADSCFHLEDIQSLWSGYGKIMRYGLEGADRSLVVVKHVKLPENARHPRGWNTDRSHLRKIKSYHVESAWYREWSRYCDEWCRVPNCFAVEVTEVEFLMVFEDLDASGFPIRKETVTLADIQACLHWLAHFHATFMSQSPAGLWETGTYWHLDTRPDEWAALKDAALREAAAQIDQCLNRARYQTVVHGDAKLANFCFSKEGHRVAAVDFQYVGGGCGMKDVAYFMGSCLNEGDCERLEQTLLDYYFTMLQEALKHRRIDIDCSALEQEWRSLYPVAWTDFHRFVKGWSPGHWKIHSYSERLARQVIEALN